MLLCLGNSYALIRAEVWSLCWNPNDSLLATASEDQTVKIWNTSDWHCVTTLTGDQEYKILKKVKARDHVEQVNVAEELGRVKMLRISKRNEEFGFS